jgi:hypothetical protein
LIAVLESCSLLLTTIGVSTHINQHPHPPANPGPLKPSIIAAPSLMRLDVSHNQLSGDLAALATAAERRSTNVLVALNASHNAISGTVPSGLAKLAVFDPMPVKSFDGWV